MIRSSKVNLIDAFDALTAVATARRPAIILPGKSLRSCDVCNHLAGAPLHLCPIGVALEALRPIIPAPADRQAWLKTP